MLKKRKESGLRWELIILAAGTKMVPPITAGSSSARMWVPKK